MTAGIYWFDSEGNHVEVAFSDAITGSPLVFTTVPEAKAAARNPEASPEIDFTNYDSVEQELRVGLPRRGTYDVTCNFVPASAVLETIMEFQDTKEERIWRIRYPKATISNAKRAEERFRGFVQVASIAPPGAQDTNPADFNFTLRVSGAYVYEKEAA